MKIREINAMRGPNYWSVRRHKLIVMVLDLEEMEERPSNSIPGFKERLEAMFPSRTFCQHSLSWAELIRRVVWTEFPLFQHLRRVSQLAMIVRYTGSLGVSQIYL